MNRLMYQAAAFGCALAIFSLAWTVPHAVAQEFGDPGTLEAPPDAVPASADVDVLTRGPVHEAFAEIINYDPKPGVVVAKVPPAPIEEVPPEARPEGDDIIWINGYWAYDDDRDDFLWVSGVWRKVPPNLRWVQGYWSKHPAAEGGEAWQWVSGFWAPTEAGALEYRDPPPASVESGPSSPAPGDDYFWTPGVWTYYSTGYRWHAGYWNAYRPGWVWVPARHVWTPRGYLFLGGYWDYPLTYRGHLYAPIWFRRPVYLAPRYYYTPQVVIGGPAISIHLFFRPTYGRLYFGDYYGPRYAGLHYHSAFSFHTHARGYDPVFAYNQVSYRHSGIDYAHRMRGWQNYYHDHADHRPPHTFAAQQQFAARHAGRDHMAQSVLATPLADLSKRPDSKQQLVRLSQEQRQTAARAAADQAKFVKQRQSIESVGHAGPRTKDDPQAAGGKPRERDRGKLDLPAGPRIASKEAPPPSLDRPGINRLSGDVSNGTTDRERPGSARTPRDPRPGALTQPGGANPSPSPTAADTKPALDAKPKLEGTPGRQPRGGASPRANLTPGAGANVETKPGADVGPKVETKPGVVAGPRVPQQPNANRTPGNSRQPRIDTTPNVPSPPKLDSAPNFDSRPRFEPRGRVENSPPVEAKPKAEFRPPATAPKLDSPPKREPALRTLRDSVPERAASPPPARVPTERPRPTPPTENRAKSVEPTRSRPTFESRPPSSAAPPRTSPPPTARQAQPQAPPRSSPPPMARQAQPPPRNSQPAARGPNAERGNRESKPKR